MITHDERLDRATAAIEIGGCYLMACESYGRDCAMVTDRKGWLPLFDGSATAHMKGKVAELAFDLDCRQNNIVPTATPFPPCHLAYDFASGDVPVNVKGGWAWRRPAVYPSAGGV